ncbi:MAG: flavodoxin family protein [Frondihabitans sp.]|nr:flavodoxin family protein [Frondihabitans sp.]
MTNVFRLDTSIRTDGSTSRSVADTLETSLEDALDDVSIVRRDLGASPLPSDAWPTAVGALQTPADARTPAQAAASALASELAEELIAADVLVFATPLYNFGVSQHLKAWVDLVVTAPQFSPRAEKVLAGRPAALVIARGGAYGPGTPRDGWDHATGWILRILRDVWGLDVTVIEAELTLASSNPAMADFVGMAEESLRLAHETAAAHGRTLADAVTATS